MFNTDLSMKYKLKLFVLPMLAVISCSVFAQVNISQFAKAEAIRVVYETTEKGKRLSPRTILLAKANEVSVFPDEFNFSKNTDPETAEQKKAVVKTYLVLNENQAILRAEMPNGEVVSSVSDFSNKHEDLKEVARGKVLGVDCRVLRTVRNSNTFDLWVAEGIPFRGTPQYVLGVPRGLVLKIVRNGDRVQQAVSLVPMKIKSSLIPDYWGRRVNASVLQHELRQSRVLSFRVFDEERICFDGSRLPSPDSLESDRVYRCGGGSIIVKKVKLPSSASGRRIFAELAQYSDGDAYDRTGSVFVVPMAKEKSFLDAIRRLEDVPSFESGGKAFHGLVSTARYDVPVELMRFITGFGVRKYNHIQVPGQTWVDSVNYKTDVTALAECLQGEVWVGAYIGNWDRNGHKVSLTLKYHPSDETSPRRALPLFNTVNYLEQAGQPYPDFLGKDSLRVKFSIDRKAKHATLFYLTTGHGGWSGGDEFNPKPNTILLDGRKVIEFVPWRDDCGSYRHMNPCSGNFDNGLSSSDYSRSNWCPASVTNPEYIYLGTLEAGEHEIVVKIPQGAPVGESMSYWCLSGTLLYH